jgi:N,N'-diacetylchitobiose transport system permease protein
MIETQKVTEGHRTAPRRSVAPSRRARARRIAGRSLPYLAIGPALITFLVLLGYPVFLVIQTSLQHFGLRELANGGETWVGLANYQRILADNEFITVVIRTFLFMVANVALTVVGGLLVALLLERLRRSVRLTVSIAMILAWATPTVTGAVIFQWLFDSKLGVVNWAIGSLGIFGSWLNHSWFETGFSAFSIITLLIVWQSIPFVAFSIYAGLLAIPKDLHEAARMDGASELQILRLITLPLVRPLILLLTFLSVIWDFKVFTQVYTMVQGGPDGQTVTLSLFAYIEKTQSRYDLASAVSVLMVIMLLVVLVPYIRHMVKAQEAA